MSSLPNSLSSSELSIVQGGASDLCRLIDPYRDVLCPVEVVLGTGAITVRRCLQLERSSVIRLNESAGQDLTVVVRGVQLAMGEVVVVEDSTSVRLTEICKSGLNSSPEGAE